jgi:hypothetical protein
MLSLLGYAQEHIGIQLSCEPSRSSRSRGHCSLLCRGLLCYWGGKLAAECSVTLNKYCIVAASPLHTYLLPNYMSFSALTIEQHRVSCACS